jgi:hypothetical protein
MKTTFCFIYNEMTIKMNRSKKRKDWWQKIIFKHKETCDACKERENLQLTSLRQASIIHKK